MLIPTPDEGRVWCEVRGSGEPLLLLSGMSQSHDGLAGQYPLAERFSLVLMDNRGTGESSDWVIERDWTDGPMTGDFTDDVISVLDALEIERTHVLGFSLGGRVAQWLASRFPERVGGLVLVSTSVGNRKGVPRDEAVSERIRNSSPFDLALLNYSPTWLGKEPDLLRTVNDSTTTRAKQRELHWHAAAQHDSWSALPRISAPTLVIHGADDEITPFANAEVLAENIAGAELLPIQGGRHAVATEFAEQVNAATIEFLARHPLAG